MPFIIRQQDIPHAIIFSSMAHMQPSMSAMFLSPLMHVIDSPCSVFSIEHMHRPRFIMHIGIPFIVIMTEGMHPISRSLIECIMGTMAASSHVHIMHIPPAIFFSSILHRAIMPMPVPIGMPMHMGIIDIMPGMPEPIGIPMPIPMGIIEGSIGDIGIIPGIPMPIDIGMPIMPPIGIPPPIGDAPPIGRLIIRSDLIPGLGIITPS
ncbi:MAG: hypothetical protein HYZ53_05990 [Planctomycetes bacterium]|nr:hypothetical protein [Planctomycetota bacterium]